MKCYDFNFENRFIESPAGKWGKRKDILEMFRKSGLFSLVGDIKPKVLHCPKCKSEEVYGSINGTHRFCGDCEYEWEIQRKDI